MSVVIEFTVPAESCALGRSLGGDPDALLELDRIVPTDGTVMPFFWLWTTDVEGFTGAARAEPAIDRLIPVDRVDGGTLFSAEWNPDAAGTLFAIAETGGAVLDARANVTEWTFEVRFTDSTSTSEFRSLCRKREVPISISRVSTTSEPPDRCYGLTVEQREALAVAYRLGYFEEPRQATLEDLAAELDVSPRAVAGRLRRGQATLLERTGLMDHPPTAPDGKSAGNI